MGHLPRGGHGGPPLSGCFGFAWMLRWCCKSVGALDIRTVQDVLGHADVATTMIYARPAARRRCSKHPLDGIAFE